MERPEYSPNGNLKTEWDARWSRMSFCSTAFCSNHTPFLSESMMFGLPHPEAGEGEVWFCNGTREGFARMSWRTKRLGQVAYDNLDKPAPEVWPIFVQRQELIDANEPIPQGNTPAIRENR